MKLLFSLALIAPLFCQNQKPPFVLPEGVELKKDLVYASPGGRDLHLDLYLPKVGHGVKLRLRSGEISGGDLRFQGSGALAAGQCGQVPRGPG